MKNMKKLIKLICALACIFSMTACQGKTATESAEDVNSASVEQIVGSLYAQFASMSPEQMDAMINAKNSEISADTETALLFKRGMTAWRDVQADLGSYVSTDGFELTIGNDTVTGTLNLTYEKRTAKFIVIFDRDVTKYEAIKVEPRYTLGEKMANAGMNTLMGMGIVFLVLIFIAFIISRFKYISKFENWLSVRKDLKKKKKENKNANGTEEAFVPKTPENAPVVFESEPDLADDLELVAVITAAVAASMNTSVDQLVVRSIIKRKNNR